MSRRAAFDVDAIAFDLDGTLLDTVHDLAAAVNGLLAEQRLRPLAVTRVAALIGKGMENLVRLALVEAGGVAPGRAELACMVARCERVYEGVLGRDTVIFDGVVEGLARLRTTGLRLAVVTNKPSRFVLPHLVHAGIAAYFDTCVGGDDAAAKKPDAAPLLLVAQRRDVVPSRLLVVGDSVNDAAAARAAGCPVVIVPYGYNEGRPAESIACDAIVRSLRDVADLVGARPIPA